LDKLGAKTLEEFGWQGLNPHSRFNSYNFDAGQLQPKYYRNASEESSIVSTKAFCPATANLLAPSRLDSRNYFSAVTCD
jgi:hypothetical protein